MPLVLVAKIAIFQETILSKRFRIKNEEKITICVASLLLMTYLCKTIFGRELFKHPVFY